ncbi:MAG: mandelate racemase/muconate lactonizing enzyme family protein, partial [Planctomycetota bacterium]|nr:mandelate racemase/muconate lactonizing enzyme family protein [Planctomycetota bacterium]
MRITGIERIDVDVPYLERVREHLQKGWGYGNRATDDEFQADEPKFRKEWENSSPPSEKTSIYLVSTDEGLTGVGEGGDVSSDQIGSTIGRDPFEFILDDSAGPLQIAFYDLMGQAVGLPMANMFGQARDSAPLAYWSHCFPPEVIQEEAKIASERGYTVHKFKRRAHTDVIEQAASIAEVVSDDYEITIDSNCTLGTVERAL